MIATCFLFGFMLVATVTDLRQQKIYNWTTYTGILVAFLLSGISSFLNPSNQPGIAIVEFMQCLYGFLGCGGIMLFCFVLFQIGGGDVKLLAMTGAFLGLEKGIETLLWTFVLGAAMAVIILIWKVGAATLLQRIYQQTMNKLSVGKWGSLTTEEQNQLQMPLYLAPSALLAVTIVRFSLVNDLLNR